MAALAFVGLNEVDAIQTSSFKPGRWAKSALKGVRSLGGCYGGSVTEQNVKKEMQIENDEYHKSRWGKKWKRVEEERLRQKKKGKKRNYDFMTAFTDGLGRPVCQLDANQDLMKKVLYQAVSDAAPKVADEFDVSNNPTSVQFSREAPLSFNIWTASVEEFIIADQDYVYKNVPQGTNAESIFAEMSVGGGLFPGESFMQATFRKLLAQRINLKYPSLPLSSFMKENRKFPEQFHAWLKQYNLIVEAMTTIVERDVNMVDILDGLLFQDNEKATDNDTIKTAENEFVEKVEVAVGFPTSRSSLFQNLITNFFAARVLSKVGDALQEHQSCVHYINVYVKEESYDYLGVDAFKNFEAYLSEKLQKQIHSNSIAEPMILKSIKQFFDGRKFSERAHQMILSNRSTRANDAHEPSIFEDVVDRLKQEYQVTKIPQEALDLIKEQCNLLRVFTQTEIDILDASKLQPFADKKRQEIYKNINAFHPYVKNVLPDAVAASLNTEQLSDKEVDQMEKYIGMILFKQSEAFVNYFLDYITEHAAMPSFAEADASLSNDQYWKPAMPLYVAAQSLLQEEPLTIDGEIQNCFVSNIFRDAFNTMTDYNDARKDFYNKQEQKLPFFGLKKEIVRQKCKQNFIAESVRKTLPEEVFGHPERDIEDDAFQSAVFVKVKQDMQIPEFTPAQKEFVCKVARQFGATDDEQNIADKYDGHYLPSQHADVDDSEAMPSVLHSQNISVDDDVKMKLNDAMRRRQENNRQTELKSKIYSLMMDTSVLTKEKELVVDELNKEHVRQKRLPIKRVNPNAEINLYDPLMQNVLRNLVNKDLGQDLNILDSSLTYAADAVVKDHLDKQARGVVNIFLQFLKQKKLPTFFEVETLSQSDPSWVAGSDLYVATKQLLEDKINLAFRRNILKHDFEAQRVSVSAVCGDKYSMRSNAFGELQQFIIEQGNKKDKSFWTSVSQ